MTGKGRNVYYSDSDLVALTVMEYLLSIGLSFEVCQHVLGILKARESWMFDESVAKEEQSKCSFHACWRGLKIETTSPVSESSRFCRAPLRSEQETQARAKFSAIVLPPATTGTMWSIWKVAT